MFDLAEGLRNLLHDVKRRMHSGSNKNAEEMTEIDLLHEVFDELMRMGKYHGADLEVEERNKRGYVPTLAPRADVIKELHKVGLKYTPENASYLRNLKRAYDIEVAAVMMKNHEKIMRKLSKGQISKKEKLSMDELVEKLTVHKVEGKYLSQNAITNLCAGKYYWPDNSVVPNFRKEVCRRLNLLP